MPTDPVDPTADTVLAANARYAAAFTGPATSPPSRHMAVLTCMDSRLDPLPSLGFDLGDVHVIRNAGGLPTDDAVRSLAISQRALGTRTVLVVQHTRCGMGGFDDAGFRAELAAESGRQPGWDVPGFDDVRESVAASVRALRDCVFLPHRDDVHGFVHDVDTGTVSPVAT